MASVAMAHKVNGHAVHLPVVGSRGPMPVGMRRMPVRQQKTMLQVYITCIVSVAGALESRVGLVICRQQQLRPSSCLHPS
jgi:hypothetical protein